MCRTSNVVMLRSIGADHVLDYTQVDFTRGGRKYDLIFDCVSTHSLTEYRRVLRPEGALVMAGDQTGRGALEIVGRLTGALLFSKLTSQTFRHLHRETQAAAIRYLEQNHARGKVVITVA